MKNGNQASSVGNLQSSPLTEESQIASCNLAIAGGALVTGAAGANVASGVVEFLIHGSDLAFKLHGQEQAKLEKLMRDVSREVSREANQWLRDEFGEDWETRDDIMAAVSEFNRIFPTLKPAVADLVEARHDGEHVVEIHAARLAPDSPLANTEIGQRIFARIISGVFGIVRSSEAHMASLNSLNFEAVLKDLDAAKEDRAEKHRQAQDDRDAMHAELLTAISAQIGIDPEYLRPLFEAVGKEVPEARFEQAVRTAVEELLSRAREPVQGVTDSEVVEVAIRTARAKFTELDTEGAVKVLDDALENDDAFQAAVQRQVRMLKEKADILSKSYQWDRAIAALERAGALDERDPGLWYQLSHMYVQLGRLGKALESAEKGRQAAEAIGDSRLLAVGQNEIGDVRSAQGDLQSALDAYEASLAVHEKLAAADPLNSQWQRDLSVSHNKIGDVRGAQGDLTGALEAYEAALVITEKLAAADPSNSVWQRDLSVSYERIGDVRRAQGDLTGALEACEAALVITEKLAAADPSNSGWQRDLSVSHNKIGDVRRAQGDLKGALEAYEAGLAIRERLVATDPSNSEWQRDLSVSHNKIGDVRRAQGDLKGALEAHEARWVIAKKLAATDPSNSEWQRDLSVSLNKIGDIRVAQGDLTGALDAYGAGLVIAEKLAATDPSNSEWQRDLSVSHNRIGDVRAAQGDLTGALEANEAGLAIRERLAVADPSNSEWQRDLIVSHVKLAEAGREPVSAYERALRVARDLMETGRLAPVDHWMVEDLEKRLAEAKPASGGGG